MKYSSLIHHHIDHLTQRYESLSESGTPEFWFVTTTLVAAKDNAGEVSPIPPAYSFAVYEKFYGRLMSRLMSNFQRKRHLQPLSYVYYDLPCSKREKSFATLSAYERWKANWTRNEHPELDTHLHSVMLIPPVLVQRFIDIAPTLERTFQALGSANRSLHAAHLQSPAELRAVMFYASKLLAQPQSLLKPLSKLQSQSAQSSTAIASVDLHTLLPKAKREPIYSKLPYERELERSLVETRKFRQRHRKGINDEQLPRCETR